MLFAHRDKSDGKYVCVAESVIPFTPQKIAELRRCLAMRSTEFSDNVSLDIVHVVPDDLSEEHES